jgi:type I restriction enzyme S subunit
MNKTIETKKVPELRFPEFEGEWIIKSLNKLSSNSGYGVSSAAKKFDGKNKYIRITDIDEQEHNFNPSILTSPKGKIDSKYYLKEGDLVFARTGASVGKTYLYNQKDGNLVFAGFLIKFSLTNCFAKFVFYQTQRKNYNYWVKVTSVRSGQPGLNVEELKKLSFFLPSIPEQQKIADFLSQVDKKIELLSQKETALRQYKKGVMQKLFSQEIRFKIKNAAGELVEPPDWEEKRLGDIATKKSSNISANKIENNHGAYNIYGANGLLKTVDFYKEEKEYISIVKDGAGVGRVLLCDAYSSVLATLDIIKPKITTNIYFLYSLLSMFRFDKYTTGSTIPHIYFKDYSKQKIKIPCIEEQTKIANFLSRIDDKIEAVASASLRHRQWKKGLLQKMFV